MFGSRRGREAVEEREMNVANGEIGQERSGGRTLGRRIRSRGGGM